MGYTDNSDSWCGIVPCEKCKQPYKQLQQEQVPGFRSLSHDICPYCGHENQTSRYVDFFNQKIESSNVAEGM